MQMLGTTFSESAFERNKKAIQPHWAPLQQWARHEGVAIDLSRSWVHKLYDLQRWDALLERVEV